jgi:hypothetical protein
MPVDQQRLEAQGVYDARAPLESLISDLDEIASLTDRMASERLRQIKGGGIVMVVGVLGFILGAVSSSGALTFGSVIAFLGGLIWLVYAAIGRGKFRAYPKRIEIARQRLAMIQQDAHPETRFSFRLALAPKPVMLSEEAWSLRKNGKQQSFEDAWLSLAGQLLDGTDVEDEIKELIRKRSYSNPRGKQRTKSRTTHLVNVRFTYPAETYGDARIARQALLNEEVKTPPSAMLKDLRVTDKAVALKAVVTSATDIAQTATMLSMGAYRVLNLARRMTAERKGNDQ